MPISDLSKTIADLPSSVKVSIDKLKYNSLIVVMLGINKEKLSDKFAVYIPQDDVVAHRICFHSYMGEGYAPKGKSLVVAEITANLNDSIYKMSDEEIVDLVVDGLAR